MQIDAFWRLVDEIRSRADAAGAHDVGTLARCTVDVLADRLTAGEILEFDAVAGGMSRKADTTAMAAAMFLIEGYLSDDTFQDFRDGLVLLGRETFEAAVADPDSLVDHPVVTPPAGVPTSRAEVSFESISSCLADAWALVTGEDEDDFWAAAAGFDRSSQAEPASPAPADEGWDLDDARAVRERLPRLAERFAQRFEPEPTTLHLPAVNDGPAGEVGTQTTLVNRLRVPGWGRAYWVDADPADS